MHPGLGNIWESGLAIAPQKQVLAILTTILYIYMHSEENWCGKTEDGRL